MNRSGDDTAVAFEAPGLTQADLAAGLLRAHGIPAFIDNEAGTATLDGYVSAQRVVKVRVPRSALPEALALLDEIARRRDVEEE